MNLSIAVGEIFVRDEKKHLKAGSIPLVGLLSLRLF
jgi:hypothetical protein